jgi:hypothetical protein
MKVKIAVLVGCMLTIGVAGSSVAQDVRFRGDDGWRSNVRPAFYGSDDHRGDNHRHIDWREAEHIVKRTYRDILGRDADHSGLRQYTRAMVYDHWSESDVRRSLRSSDEYRRRHRHDYERNHR